MAQLDDRHNHGISRGTGALVVGAGTATRGGPDDNGVAGQAERLDDSEIRWVIVLGMERMAIAIQMELGEPVEDSAESADLGGSLYLRIARLNGMGSFPSADSILLCGVHGFSTTPLG